MSSADDETFVDPGWSPGPGGAWLFVPIVGGFQRRRRLTRSTPALVTLRTSFVAFCMSLVYILVVAVFVFAGDADSDARTDVVGTALVVASVGLIALTGVFWARRRELNCTSDDTLAHSFFTRTFLGIAVAEAPALSGFIGVLLAESLAPYFVGAAASVVGLAVVAPTRAELARTQEHLGVASCDRSIGLALMNPWRLRATRQG